MNFELKGIEKFKYEREFKDNWYGLPEHMWWLQRPMPGVQYRFQFDNNYRASVIKHPGSYGYEDDLWELAVLYFDPETGENHLCYDTEITDDVEGYLTNQDVVELLSRINNLS